MTVCARTPLIVMLSALTVGTGLAAAGQRAVVSGAHDAPLTATVPVDPRITVGTLSNGLRYYVRANKQPQNRAETPARGQRRIGARRRRPAGARALRRAHGLQRDAALSEAGRRSRSCSRSACASARTSTPTPASTRRSTSCRFPTDNPAVIDRSLLILEDWAHDVSFDPAEIDKERGVILEEWRLGPRRRRAACTDAQLPVLLKGSRYADRLPIGKPEIHPALQAAIA